MHQKKAPLGVVLAALILRSTSFAAAQQGPPAEQQPAQQELIQLNFPDNVELKLLLDYVSERLNTNIIYDEQQAAQRLTIRAPAAVPKSSLLTLLQSVLRQKNMMLVPADTPGWLKLVQINNLAANAQPTTQPEKAAPASSVVSQLFFLRHAEPNKLDQIIRPYLTTPGGNSVAIPEQKLLIVTDYGDAIARIASLIAALDKPGKPVVIDVFAVQHADAQTLATQVVQLLTSKQKASGAQQPAPTVDIQPDPRSGRLIMVGEREEVDAAKTLSTQLDVAIPTRTATYQLRYVPPERIDKLVRELASGERRPYQSAIDRDSGLLIVTAGDQVHDQFDALVKRLDVAMASEEQSPIRFYKLYNTTAADVLQTLQAIEGEGGVAQIQVQASPPAQSQQPAATAAPEQATSLTPGGSQQRSPNGLGPLGSPLSTLSQGPLIGQQTPDAASQPRSTLKTKDATLTSDPNTNTIIIVARPSIQVVYEQIIRSLDKRRPQVLIECTIVTLDTTGNYSLGVELSGRASFGSYDLLSFSSFGLSEANPETGELSLIPGLGFNGALLSTDIADVIIRALKTSGRTEVLSAPRVLVNDHGTGVLSSVEESPFTSVNASNTVSTTSFAGYASAGTTISVTPHISEADHLQLDYVVALNSFTGAGGSGIPPPRQSNTLQSKVTIPDGSTIVVGGLNRRNASHTKAGVPFLSDIPGVGTLFSSTSDTDRRSTLFVFIRPIILRDDQFEDLKYFSERDQQRAQLPPDMPISEPLEMR